MSKQVQFFAHPTDVDLFHCWVTDQFPDLKVIRSDRGSLSDLRPVHANAALQGDQQKFLVFPWATDGIVAEPIEEMTNCFWLNYQLSPVVEYLPCSFDRDYNRIGVGRLYWAYDGQISSDEKHDVASLFKWIIANSIALGPHRGATRVFEHAARSECLLDYRQPTPEGRLVRKSPRWPP